MFYLSKLFKLLSNKIHRHILPGLSLVNVRFRGNKTNFWNLQLTTKSLEKTMSEMKKRKKQVTCENLIKLHNSVTIQTRH